MCGRGFLWANVPALADGMRVSMAADRHALGHGDYVQVYHAADIHISVSQHFRCIRSLSAQYQSSGAKWPVAGCGAAIPGARNRVEIVGLEKAVGKRPRGPTKPSLRKTQHSLTQS